MGFVDIEKLIGDLEEKLKLKNYLTGLIQIYNSKSFETESGMKPNNDFIRNNIKQEIYRVEKDLSLMEELNGI